MLSENVLSISDILRKIIYVRRIKNEAFNMDLNGYVANINVFFLSQMTNNVILAITDSIFGDQKCTFDINHCVLLNLFSVYPVVLILPQNSRFLLGYALCPYFDFMANYGHQK